MVKKKTLSPIKVPKSNSKDLPASRAMLKLVKSELQENIYQVGESVNNLGLRVLTVEGEVKSLRQDVVELKDITSDIKIRIDENHKEHKQEFAEVKDLIRDTNIRIDEHYKEHKQEFAEVKDMIRDTNIRIDEHYKEHKQEFAEVKDLIRDTNIRVDNLQMEFRKEISEVKTMIHKTNLLVEEQSSNNRIVLEGLQMLWERQIRFEDR